MSAGGLEILGAVGASVNLVQFAKEIFNLAYRTKKVYDNRNVPVYVSHFHAWSSGVVRILENLNETEREYFALQLEDCKGQMRRLKRKLEKLIPESQSSYDIAKSAIRRELTGPDIKEIQNSINLNLNVIQVDRVLNIHHRLVSNSSTPRAPSANYSTKWIVPHSKNPWFLGRQCEILEIQDKLFNDNDSNGASRSVTIYGPNGVGKSQICVEFAHQIQKERKNCSVYWIAADTLQNFTNDFNQIAQHYNLSILDFRHFLSSEEAREWLLIVDNAKDLNWLDEYLPRGPKGYILFATSDSKLASRKDNVICLQPFDHKTAIKLFKSFLTSPDSVSGINNKNDMKDLFKKLDYMPSAIKHASTYINQRRCSIQDYIDRFQTDESSANDFILDSEASEISKPVALAMYTSFKELQNSCPFAIECLCTIVCFDSQHIAEELFPKHKSKSQLYEAINILTAHAFIFRDEQGLYSIDNQLYATIRNQLRNSIEIFESYMAKATSILVKGQVFFKNQHTSTLLRQDVNVNNLNDRYHLLIRLKYSDELLHLLETSASWKSDTKTIHENLLYANFIPFMLMKLRSKSQMCLSLNFCQRLYGEAKYAFGKSDILTLRYLQLLVFQHVLDKNFTKALELQITLVERSKNSPEADIESALFSQLELCWLYRKTKMFDKLKPTESELIHALNKLLTKQDVGLLLIVIRVLLVLRWQLDEQESQSLMSKITETAKKLIRYTPQSSTSLHNVFTTVRRFTPDKNQIRTTYYFNYYAFVYEKLGRYDEASDIHQMVRENMELLTYEPLIYLKDHLVQMMDCLGLCFDKPLLESSLNAMKKIFKNENRHLLVEFMDHVMKHYVKEKKWVDSGVIGEELLQLQTRLYPAGNYDTIQTKIRLSHVYNGLKDFDRSLSLLKSIPADSVQVQEASSYIVQLVNACIQKDQIDFALDSIKVQSTKYIHDVHQFLRYTQALLALHERVCWYFKAGNLEDAVNLIQKIINFTNKEQMCDDVMARTLVTLADIYRYKDNVEDSISMYKQACGHMANAFEYYKQSLQSLNKTDYDYHACLEFKGSLEMEHGHLMLKLGYRYIELSRFDEAYTVFDELAELNEEKSYIYVHSKEGIANIFWTQNQFDEAINVLDNCFQTCKDEGGPYDYLTVEISNHLVKRYVFLGRENVVLDLIEPQALASKEKLGQDHWITLNFDQLLGRTYTEMEQYEKALVCLNNVLSRYQKTKGANYELSESECKYDIAYVHGMSGYAHGLSGKLDKGIEDLEDLIKNAQDDNDKKCILKLKFMDLLADFYRYKDREHDAAALHEQTMHLRKWLHCRNPWEFYYIAL